MSFSGRLCKCLLLSKTSIASMLLLTFILVNIIVDARAAGRLMPPDHKQHVEDDSPTPPIGQHQEVDLFTVDRRMQRQQVEGGNSTTVPSSNVTSTEPSKETNAETSTTSTTTLAAETTMPMINISSIDNKNYTYVDHSTFNHSLNDWDFDGRWEKFNLSSTSVSPVPPPWPQYASRRPRVEGGGDPGVAVGGTGAGSEPSVGGGGGEENTIGGNEREGANGTNSTAPTPPDLNNFVFVNYVSRCFII